MKTTTSDIVIIDSNEVVYESKVQSFYKVSKLKVAVC